MTGANLNIREHTPVRQTICKQSNKMSLVAGKSCDAIDWICQIFVPKMPSCSTHWIHLRFCSQCALKKPGQRAAERLSP